jgi:hypothetical protein
MRSDEVVIVGAGCHQLEATLSSFSFSPLLRTPFLLRTRELLYPDFNC